jgi:two-component system, sensor histidine kinase PdtaS
MKLFFTFILSIPLHVFSQQNLIDSLKKEIVKNPNNISAKILFAENLANTKPDSAISISNIIIKEGLQSDTIIGKAYNIIANAYKTKNKIDTAEKIYTKAAEYFIKCKYYYGQAATLTNRANIKWQKGQFNDGIELLNVAEPLLLKCNHEKKYTLLARVYQQLAENYQNIGLFEKSIENYQKSEKTIENTHDKIQYAVVYSGLGRMFTRMGEFPKAISNYNQCIEISKQINFTPGITNGSFNLASTYFQYSLYDSTRRNLLLDSTEYVLENMEAALKGNGNNYKTATYYMLKGQVLQYRTNYSSSIIYYDSAINVAEQTKMGSDLAKSFASKGDAYDKMNDSKNAIQYYLKALDIFKANAAKNDLKQLYYHLAKLYFNIRDFTSAAKYYDLYYPLLDEILNEEKIKATKQFEAKYELSKKETKIVQQQNEITKQEQGLEIINQQFLISKQKAAFESQNQKLTILLKEKEVADKEIEIFKQAKLNELNEKRQAYEVSLKEATISTKEATISTQKIEIKTEKQKNYWLVTGSAIAALVAFILGWLYKRIRRQKKQIEIQKQEILHNNRNNIQQLISIFNRQSETEGLKENSLANQERLYTLNLLNKLLYENGENNHADIKEYLTQLSSAKEIGSGKTVKIVVNTPNIKLKSNLLKDIGLIVNELTTNSIKYAFQNILNPNIEITVNNQNEQYLNLQIKDNGSGLPDGFNLQQQRNSFGLEFVNDLVTQHHGTIKAYNNNGSCFDINLKVR